MNNYQLRRYEMYGMVIKYLNDHKEKLNDFPGFKDNYDKLSMKREEILDAGRDQSQYTNKKSIEKKALRKKLEVKIVEISREDGSLCHSQ